MNTMRGFINIVASPTRLDEAVWVIKSKDGVEKRFKKADSPEALAWPDTVAKKQKPGKFSKRWWDDKAADYNFTGTLPWAKIADHEISDFIEQQEKEESALIPVGYDHWNLLGKSSVKIDEVLVATATIGLMYQVVPGDGLGVEDTVEDVAIVTVRRDVTNPDNLQKV